MDAVMIGVAEQILKEIDENEDERRFSHAFEQIWKSVQQERCQTCLHMYAENQMKPRLPDLALNRRHNLMAEIRIGRIVK